MNTILTLIVCFLTVPAFSSEVHFEGVDVYRSKTLTVEKIEAETLPLIRSYSRLRGRATKASRRRAARLKGRIEDRIRGLGDFAFVNLYYSEYFVASKRASYVTIDVVDSANAADRLPFRSGPKKSGLNDPEGLLGAWKQYETVWEELGRTGTSVTERSSCPSFHCRWGAADPRIERLDRRFTQFVPSNKKALNEIMFNDADPERRRAAVFLLAYLKNGKKVSDAMADALRDPDESVRAAGLEVLSDISVYHSAVPLNINRLVDALDYPSSSDRSKAMAVLVGKVEDPKYRGYLLKFGAPRLLRLLQLKQPSNHDLAYTLLGLLSRQSFERRDYDSWARWVKKNSSGKKKRRRKKLWE